MTNQQFQYLMQLYGGNQVASSNPSAASTPAGGLYPGINFDPDIEPSPIPMRAPFNLPHQAMNVPPEVFQGPDYPRNIPHSAMDFYPGTVGAGDLGLPPSTIGPQVDTGQQFGPGTFNDQFALPTDNFPNDPFSDPNFSSLGPNLPPSPDFGPSDLYLPDDYGPATVMAPTGNPIYSGAGYQPGTSIQDFGGPPIDFGQPISPAELAPPEYASTPTSSDMAAANQNPLGSDWPFYINEFPSGDGSGVSSAPGVPIDSATGMPTMTGAQASGGVPYGYPGPGIGGPDQSGPWVEHNSAPWYPGRPDILNSADRNVYGTPPERGLHPGQMIKDAAGNFLDGSGRIIMSAAQAAGKLPGEISDILGKLGNNITNDPRNTDPRYLASMGYHEMGPEGSGFMIPGGVSGPSVGAFDTGTYGAINAGSYFHGGASAGMQHGATSVAGAFNGLGAGPSPVNLGATSMGNVLDRNYLLKMYKGLYTPGGIWGMNRAQSPSPWAQTGGSPAGFPPPQTFEQFHQGQVNLGNILRSNPSALNLLGGVGRPPNIARGTPPKLPT